jgi:hypothetical protein
MSEQLIETRIQSGTGVPLSDEVSSSVTAPPQVFLKAPFKYVFASGAAAALSVSPSSAVTPDQFQLGEHPGKTFLTSSEYVDLENRLMSAYRNQMTVLATLNSRIDDLAAVVSLLMHRDDANALSENDEQLKFDASDPGLLLNRACDEGIFDGPVKALAERELSSGDRYARLAAIRAISLMDAARGKKLIANELEQEDSAVARRALEGTLRAIS